MNDEMRNKIRRVAELEIMADVDLRAKGVLTKVRRPFYQSLSSNWEAANARKEVAKTKSDILLVMRTTVQDLTEADVSELTTQALRMNRYLFTVAAVLEQNLKVVKIQVKLFYKFTPNQWEHYVKAVNTRFSKTLTV
ncbi:MAG: hypothetical protein COB09_18730 [Thalassobium sp.]|nr:MAG: hypothetical protein COB09_18730 [Thalassobium sp.]